MRLIDADALKEYIDAQKGRPFIGCTIGEALKMMVDEQPTIERKTGKWIKGKCSNCGAHAPFWPMASTYYESDYCPNCGSEMRGDDHEND